MATDEVLETRSITCSQLPAEFIIDKQEARKFFIQFGAIKNFIFKPARQEYTIEFSTPEAAQKALNAQVNFIITPTKLEPVKSSDELIDPDVQAELESMLPSKPNVKQSKLNGR
jgi:RNA recognition motif-containing protein